MKETYIVELADRWRLITLEFPHEDMPECRSVKSIEEFDTLAELEENVQDLSKIERIVARPSDLVEPFTTISQKIDAEAQLENITRLYLEIAAVEEKLELLRDELKDAICQ